MLFLSVSVVLVFHKVNFFTYSQISPCRLLSLFISWLGLLQILCILLAALSFSVLCGFYSYFFAYRFRFIKNIYIKTLSTVDTFENGALLYDTGLPSPQICVLNCASPMVKLPLHKAKFRPLIRTDKNEIKTLKITVILFNFVFLCLFWASQAAVLRAFASRKSLK